MKRLLSVVLLGSMAVACRPAPRDPSFDYNQTRQDTKVDGIKLDPESALAKIGADLFWKKTSGKNNEGNRVRIAVVGTGIDYNIPDLRDALVINMAEMGEKNRANGIDDDGNGYIDDVFGYDFFSGDNMPFDWHGHDTYTASIIAATGRTNPAVVGIAPNAEILVARYIGPDGTGKGFDAVQALNYAIVNNAKVIYFNYPQGGFPADQTELVLNKFKEAGSKNILVVLPAGNLVTASLVALATKLDNVVVVAGLDGEGKIAANSVRGKNIATVAAPIAKLSGYYPGGEVQTELGTTSVAAALTAGAAALLSTQPGMGSVQKIKQALLGKAVDRKAPALLDVLSEGPLSLSSF